MHSRTTKSRSQAKPTKRAHAQPRRAHHARRTAPVAKAPVRMQSASTMNMATMMAKRPSFMTKRFFSTDAVPAAPVSALDEQVIVPSRRATILNHSLVLLSSGPDDKDVLPLIAQTVSKLGGSVEESRMTVLGADFTVSTLLTIPMTVAPKTVENEILSVLPDFSVACRLTSPAPSSSSYEPAKILALDVEGPDQPKIVSTFAQILYKHNVNVKDVITDTSSAPFLGYNVFAMKAVVSIPLKTNMKELEGELQEFETKFGLNLAVSDPAEQHQQMMQEQQPPAGKM